jgi:hypothetical protein
VTVKRWLTAVLALAVLASVAPSPAEGRGRRVRKPRRSKLVRILRDSEKSVYFLSRQGLQDLSLTFPKFTRLGWIKRIMHWKAPDRIHYRIEDLPEGHQKIQRTYVGKLIEQFDGTMYPLVSRPFVDILDGFELSAPDPKDLTKIVLTPKPDPESRRRYRRKQVELNAEGLPWRITTFWDPAPPTKEELEIDPDFEGKEVETFVEIRYRKLGRWYFIRRLDIEGKGKKVIVDIEKWEKRGKYWLPAELGLIDPFAGNEFLKGKDIRVDTGLKDEMFEGFPHRLER